MTFAEFSDSAPPASPELAQLNIARLLAPGTKS